ncbi:MAG: 16S rRNA (cytosine(967)-C(5))-methyltransferase RsmB [Clostridia bacterium]|nr:16S rRNA (cytosine(967)-C(5))-methyltransferase RsmB [Clostridia bacterium]
MNDLLMAFEVLLSIYKDGAYSNLELNKRVNGASNQAIVTRLVYGVLQKDVQLDYYLAKVVSKRPPKTIAILLKLGMYTLTYINSIPRYAVVDSLVTICEKYGKRQLKGFVNSTLKNFDASQISLPNDRFEALSVDTSVPLWLVKAYCKQYGYDRTNEFLSVDTFTKEHIRPNLRKQTLDELKSMLDAQNITYTQSIAGGLFVDNYAYIKSLNEKGLITYQSMTSMLAAQAMEVKDGEMILDICSAPGGKAVYMSELADVVITACDIHEHRLQLIRDYINRIGAVNITVQYNDGSAFNQEFVNKFDKTLCDVPCSGLGVVGKKADIYLTASMEKCQQLATLQYAILCNASKYSKKRIVYSTCTTLREENYNIVGRFVKENKDWQVVKSQQYLPDGKGQDGFFIAVLDRRASN